MDLQYWHWLVFGMILIIAELFIPSFTIFWFGLGALAVGGLFWFFRWTRRATNSLPVPVSP